MRYILETSRIKGIPTLSIAPQTSRPCPVVFFVSGYGADKEQGLRVGTRLAEKGIFFLSFDPWLHGERYDERLEQAADPELGGVYPPETGLDTFLMMMRVIQRCLADIQTLRAHFSGDPRVDLDRCGVTGLSMGGYAAFLAFTRIPEMKAAVPMIGIPNFTQRWIDVLDECAFSVPAWAKALQEVQDETRAHTEFVRGIDPYPALPEAAPRALLIMNCDFDTDQPKFYSVYAYRELLPAYADHPERLRLRIYPAGHTVTRQMETDAVDWFERHLLAEN